MTGVLQAALRRLAGRFQLCDALTLRDARSRAKWIRPQVWRFGGVLNPAARADGALLAAPSVSGYQALPARQNAGNGEALSLLPDDILQLLSSGTLAAMPVEPAAPIIDKDDEVAVARMLHQC